jgi:transposase
LLRETVDLTLEDLCTRYTETYPVPVNPSTRPATLNCLKITRKRKSHSDPKKVTEPGQSDTKRDHQQVDDILLDQRLYLDETGSRLNLTLPYGRAPEERTRDRCKTGLAGSVGEYGGRPFRARSGRAIFPPRGNDGRTLRGLSRRLWLARLSSGQTLIMDQHPVHLASKVRAFLDRHHIRYIYLPPYSPELNPIEEAWSKFRHFLKRQKACTLARLLELLQQAGKLITPDDAQGFFQHAENYSQVPV